MRLLLVSDGVMPLSRFVELAGGLVTYVDRFILRENQATARELLTAIEQMKAAGVPLNRISVNDRIDVAVAAGAGGVQLAHHSLPVERVRAMFKHVDKESPNMPPLLGCSVHSPEEAVRCEKEGADYALYGHIYPTGSKPGLQPRGLQGLAAVTARVALPVYAIGGITPDRIGELRTAGAAGIAVMSGILGAADPAAAAKCYAEALARGEDQHEPL